METKKHPKHDLERRYTLFLNIGLVLSLAFVVTAFEWKFYDDRTNSLVDITHEFEPLFEVKQTVQIPPAVVKAPPVIIAKPDEEELENDIKDVIDTEYGEGMSVEEMIYSAPLPEEEVDTPESYVEQMPEPVGGMGAFYKHLADNINYPKQAIRAGIEGKVFVKFVVEKDGTLSNIEVVRGIGAGCDEEAVKAINSAPKWKPGRQGGRTMRVTMIVPVNFKFQ